MPNRIWRTPYADCGTQEHSREQRRDFYLHQVFVIRMQFNVTLKAWLFHRHTGALVQSIPSTSFSSACLTHSEFIEPAWPSSCAVSTPFPTRRGHLPEPPSGIRLLHDDLAVIPMLFNPLVASSPIVASWVFLYFSTSDRGLSLPVTVCRARLCPHPCTPARNIKALFALARMVAMAAPWQILVG
jgi:hypothetical protein